MALRIADKKQITQEINEVAQQALSLVTAEYRGLTSQQMTQLRREAKNAGIYLRVVRNTLARRALAETEFACAHERLRGPIVLAFSRDDPASAARLFKGFVKSNEMLMVTSIALSGKLLPANQLDAVASLPTREQALGMLVGTMQAPVVKLARTLAETYTKLVRTFAAVRDQKQAAK